MEEEIKQFLRNICNDFNDDSPAYPECEGQGKDDESCAEHEDCGICRYEYMKRKGWLVT